VDRLRAAGRQCRGLAGQERMDRAPFATVRFITSCPRGAGGVRRVLGRGGRACRPSSRLRQHRDWRRRHLRSPVPRRFPPRSA